MGSDDLFKRRREARKKRQHEYKPSKANSFLIVTEGERTEPLYFRGIQKLIIEKIGGMVDVVEVPLIEIQGKGCSTGKLLEVTEQIVKESKIIYQNIWVVFDKDDFEDFDYAIKEGYTKGYNIAWSNQSFEYWLYLHFYYSDSALHRDNWCEKLSDIFKQYKIENNTYQKNYENIFQIVNSYGSVEFAIKNAKRRMSGFDEKQINPSEYDPGTMVYKLVRELTKYLEE